MQDTARRNTREALMRAAERLFAERGLGGVSVRDITLAAGARNQSALHYHFGGMEALIREVFARRYREIEETRRKRLAEVGAQNLQHDIDALMQAAIGPLFEACLHEAGRLYARFCVQLTTDPRFNVIEIVSETGMESASLMRDWIAEALPDLPEEVLWTRLRRLFTISILLVADHARLVEEGAAPPVAQATREAASTLSGFLRASPPG